LVEAVLALAVIAAGFVSLFAVYSHTMQRVRDQQELAAATITLHGRFEQIRAGNWTHITSAERLKQSILSTPGLAANNLLDLEEEIVVSQYPPQAEPPVPIRVRRKIDGAVEIVSQPDSTAFLNLATVRVDVRARWMGLRGRSHFRETSAVVALGGILK
jgi:hypothetical protein